MIVTNIISCIKVTKENEFSGLDMFIDVGSKIRVIENSGNITQGIFLELELSQYEEQDDILHIKTLDGMVSIGVSYVKDIEELD